MNYAEEFKRRMKKINKEITSPIADIKATEKVTVPVGTPLFTIYKRSLPVGLNRPVLMNLTEDDAKKAMKRLKSKQYKDPDGTSHCIYYEKVEVGIVDDLYANPKPTMQQEIEILRGADSVNYDYNFGDEKRS